MTQRTGEFGIRLALGAQRSEGVTSFLRDGLKTILPGIALGVAGAVLVTRLIATELYGVSPLDVATFIAVTVVMVAVAILACSIPARRASRVEAAKLLRLVVTVARPTWLPDHGRLGVQSDPAVH